jgi:hypothetical protein
MAGHSQFKNTMHRKGRQDAASHSTGQGPALEFFELRVNPQKRPA